MKDVEEFTRILQADTNKYSMLWDAQNDWHPISEGCASLSKETLLKDGINGLLAITAKEDYELCRTFLNELSIPPAADNPVKYQSTALHLLTPGNDSVFYHVSCDSLWENGKPGCILLTIRGLSAEEIYRIHLAQKITNDKHPSFLIDGANDIMSQHPEKKYALIQFDIAKFKMINELYGETFGDELLTFIIQGLKLICNKDQLYVRLSADIFMIFTPYETKWDILSFINQIIAQLSNYKGISYRLVFGVCYIDDPTRALRIYGDNAAIARQSIKNNVLSHTAFFTESLKQNVRTHKFIEDRMELALANGEFVMFLQPKYSISQNKMIGAEALVRWISPEFGLIMPNDFIPIFEQNGFIVKMDCYIWEQACITIRNWIDAGIEPLPISVNVSRVHLHNHNFIQVLNDLIAKYQLDKKYLEIEITETAKSEDAINGVNMLKDNGYTLLMDDFGSGYSSLNTLKDTRFDVIKIDRAFLQNFISSGRGQKIVEHIIQMTKSIGLDLIAEGVENKEEAVFLSKCGCDKVQGYYYAKPMSLNDFNKKRE